MVVQSPAGGNVRRPLRSDAFKYQDSDAPKTPSIRENLTGGTIQDSPYSSGIP